MKQILFAVSLILLGSNVFAAAQEPVAQSQDLEPLEKSWENSRDKYRDALKAKLGAIQVEMEHKEGLLEKEDSSNERKMLLGHLRRLQTERDDVNTKIREINASDVVKFSTGRDKLVSVLTGQATT